MALGISFPLVSSVLLMWPLVRAEEGNLPMLWVAGAMTALVGFMVGRLLAQYLHRAYVSASPDSYYRCIGVAMWHAAVGGMILGGVVMAVLFGQGMMYGMIFPEVSFSVMVMNSLIIGASYGVMLGLMTGLITGGVAAYWLSQGYDVADDEPSGNKKSGTGKRKKKKK